MIDEELQALQTIGERVIDLGVRYGFQMLGAVVILTAGYYAARWAGGTVERLCHARRLDVTLGRFFGHTVRITVLAFVVIAALSNFGITIAPLVAALGAAAFGSSLALAGPLSNYGAGLTIIMTRPFKVGDNIAVQGVSGVVDDIRLGATYLRAEDGEMVIVPNKDIVGHVIVNSFANRVVELAIGIGHDNDPARAIAAVNAALAGNTEVVREPPPQVGIGRFTEPGLELFVRYWVPGNRYYPVQFAANAAIWTALGAAQIHAPVPRQDVRLVHGPET